MALCGQSPSKPYGGKGGGIVRQFTPPGHRRFAPMPTLPVKGRVLMGHGSHHSPRHLRLAVAQDVLVACIIEG